MCLRGQQHVKHYNDIQAVMDKYKRDQTVVSDTIGITDITGNMGKLGKHCRDHKCRHGTTVLIKIQI